MEIRVSREGRRGCGHRKGGALYLMAPAPDAPCGRLPLPLHICPTCGNGVKPARGWTWIDPQALFANLGPCRAPQLDCGRCPVGDLSRLGERAGLLWCGAEYYDTPEEWLEEARGMGISRRIRTVPKGFELGKTWVLMAHRHGRTIDCESCAGQSVEERAACEECDGAGSVRQAAVFTVFRPTGIEYVVRGDETEAELEALVARGIEPVKVEQIEDEPDQPELDWSDQSEDAGAQSAQA